ncbi:LamG domain-containing protein [Patescibacteria group bacterium]|nr:LamG domain-containing protein [Patescibacteria group bacterium]
MPNLPYISPDLIAQYQGQLAKTTSFTTAKRKMASLNKFFGWAHNKGHIKENPLVQTQPLSEAFEPPKRRKPGVKTIIGFGVLALSLVLMFLLARKLQLPIPFLFTPASENRVTQLPQPTGGPGQPTTGSTSEAPSTSTLLSPWTIFAKMTLKDASGSASLGAQSITFKLYKSPDDPTALWTSGTKQETPDTNGDITIALDSVPTNVFFGNDKLYLGATIGGTEIKDRIPVSSANSASNLQGYTPANPEIGAGPGTIPVIADDGSLLLASQAPAIRAKQGNLLVEGQTVTLSTPTGSDGNIEINPDGFGYAHFLFEGTGQNFLNAQAPNLTSGSLFYGIVANGATGYDLIRLQSGSQPITRFSVDALGNTGIGGNLSTGGTQRLSSGGALSNVTGYSQTSGNFTITQSPGNFASITQTGSALADLLTLTLDERDKPMSTYSTLTLNRYNAPREGAALYVKNGTAIFNDQIRLGRFVALPTAIGTGSVIYNSTDNQVYFSDGTIWQAFATAATAINWWGQANGVLNPKNSTVDLLIGGTSSSSAKFAFINVDSGTPTASIAGNLTLNSAGVIQTTLNRNLTIGGDSTGGIILSPLNGVAEGSVTPGATDVTDLGISSLAWRNVYGQTLYQNSNQVCDVSGNCFAGANDVWNQTNGTIYPKNSTVDVLIGGTATDTAKFAFINVIGSGTPTASISAGAAGATYLSADGTLATTAKQTLSLGGTTTGNVSVLNNSGSAFATFDTTNSRVGIGTSAPASDLEISKVTPEIRLTTSGDGLYTRVTRTTTSNNAARYNLVSKPGSDPYALEFDGDDGVTVPDSATNRLMGSDWTIRAWVYLDTTAASTRVIIDKKGTDYARKWYFGINPSRQLAFGFWSDAAGFMNSTGTVSLGTWTHVQVSRDTGTNTIYFAINGNIESQPFQGDPGTPSYFNGLMRIGLDGGDWPPQDNFDGKIDEIEMSNVVRNTANFTPQTTKLSPDANTKALWHFDEGTGTSTSDSSGNGNIGTLSSDPNDPAWVTGYVTDPGSTVEALVWSSQNGISANEQGIQTFGDSAGRTLVQGGTIRFYISSSEKARIDASGNLGIGTTTPLEMLDVAGNATVSGNLTFYGGARSIQGTLMNDLTIGGDTTGNITINPLNAVDGGSVTPGATDVTDLGTASLEWRNFYAQAMLQSGNAVCDASGNCNASTGYWNQNDSLGILYPKNSTVDVLIGGTATDTAKFAFINVDSGNPTASISGNIALGAETTTTAPQTFLNIYNGGSFNVQGSVGGDSFLTSRIYIDSAGQVGINNAAPSTQLDVTGTGRFSSTLTASNGLTLTTGALNLTGTSGALTLSGLGASSVSFGANDILFTAGNFNTTATGINSTAIGATIRSTGAFTTLDSSGNTTLSSGAGATTTIGNATGTFAVTSTALNVTTAGAVSGVTTLSMSNQLTNSYANTAAINLTGIGAGITFAGTGPNQIITAASQNLALMPGGNVGVGTTSPVEKLDVAGNATVSGNLTFYGGARNIRATLMAILTIGGDTTGDIVVNPLNAIAGGAVKPNTTDVTDLGTSASLEFRNIWGKTIYQSNNQVCDTSGNCLGGATDLWNQDDVNGILYPKNSTVDVLLGGTSTDSAKFAFINMVGTGTPTASVSAGAAGATFLTADGNLATTANQSLTLGGVDTGNIYLQAFGTSTTGLIQIGNGAGSGTPDLLALDIKNTAGDPVSAPDGAMYYNSDSGEMRCKQAGSWGACGTGGGGSSFWTQDDANGILYPMNSTVDVLIGGTATDTAKFAFMNVDSTNSPTASISGTTANVATYLTGEGNLATTNMANLTIGGTSTGNITLSPLNGSGIVDINAATIDLSTQIVGVTLNNAANALNFDSNTLSIDALNNRVGIGTASPLAGFHIVKDDASTNTQIELARITRSTSGGTAATNIGSYTSSYLEDNASSLVEAGRAGFILRNVTAGADTAGEFSVSVERETYTDMIEVLSAYATDGIKYICGNSTRSGGADCFGFTIGSANQTHISFDGTTRLTYDYTSPTLSIMTPSTVNLKFVTLGSGETIIFDEGNDGEDMYVNASGYVGIGSTTVTAATSRLYVTNDYSATGKALAIFNQTESQDIFTASAAGTPRFVITNAGNVGIGTATPGNPLVVVSTDVNHRAMGVFETALANGNRLTQWIGKSIAANSAGYMAYTPNATAYLNNLSLGHYGTDDILNINQSGGVGIGTTSPVEKLAVAGNATVSGNLTFYGGARSIQGTLMNDLTIGGSTTGNIILNPLNALSGGSVTPSTTDVTDLGLSGLEWKEIHGQLIYQGANQVCDTSGAGCTTSGLWAEGTAPTNGGVIYPKNLTEDVLIGGNSTDSAKFAFINVDLASPPTASISAGAAGATYLTADGNLATTANQSLTLGGLTTGNIFLESFGADTGHIQIGDGAGSSNPDLLALDIKNDAGDPAGTAGAVYYNSSGTPKFRCYQGGSWVDCISAGAATGWTLSNPFIYTTNADYQVGIGTTTTADIISKLYVTNDGALTGKALAIFNQPESQDILTASASSVTKMVVSKAGDLTATGFLQIGAAWTPGTIPATSQAYSRFGSAIPDHFGGSTTDWVIFSGDTEFRGTLFLDSADGVGGGISQIADNTGTGTIIFPANEKTTPHELTAGNWMVTNPINTGNVGQAALIVDQQAGGDIFTASFSGSTKFTIANNGNITATGSGTMLTIGGGTGKVDIGTIDPVYNIGGTRYATYLSGMTGVKEETTGNVSTDEFVPGVGYRHSIDFKDAQNGSDLWLFSKTTNLKNNMGKMVVLLSPAGNTRAWYDVDTRNYLLSIYTARPTTVSYRLTAPRFDYTTWTNLNDNPSATGFDIKDENLTVNPNGDVKPPVIPSLADFEIVSQQAYGIQNIVYSIWTKAGQIIDELGAFGNLIAGNILAGAIQVQEVTSNLLTANKIISPLADIDTVRTRLISPLPDQTDVAVQIGGAGTDSGQLVIQNASGSAVASVDTAGNASFSGQVTSDKLQVTSSASIAGTLYADDIKSTTLDDIQNLLHQVEQDQNLLAQAATWNANTATGSSAIANIQNLFVTDQAAINSLSVSTSISVGTDLVFQSQNTQYGILNTVNSLSAPLSLQSLAMAPVEIMAGKVKVLTNGDVQIEGNLYVAGVVESSGLTVRSINNPVAASIDASGSATFNSVSADKFILAVQAATASADINGTITTNATAGQAIINAGVSEITIKNPSISDYTLVYVTPTSSTLNNVLYVKSKGAGYFTVGFSNPINVDVTFNWWVIDVKQ